MSKVFNVWKEISSILDGRVSPDDAYYAVSCDSNFERELHVDDVMACRFIYGSIYGLIDSSNPRMLEVLNRHLRSSYTSMPYFVDMKKEYNGLQKEKKT